MIKIDAGKFISLIRTEDEHKKAVSRIIDILGAVEGSPEDRELDALVEAVKAYEAETIESDFPDPISAIKFRMEEAGLTQRDLVPLIGSRAKVSEVLSGKRELTMSMARALHEHLGVPADALLKKPGATFGPAPTPDELRRFPWREMVKREWLDPRPNLRDYEEEMFGHLEGRAGGPGVMTHALLRENGHRRMNAKTNCFALWAWCLQVLGNANENLPQCDYVPGVVDNTFLREVAQCSSKADGPLKAREHLANHGIALVVEKHLKNTYLDGAVLRLGDGRPVVGLTLRYDRIDNFWFTLMHELAHVSLHLEKNGVAAFFDDLDLKESSRMEVDDPELKESGRMEKEADEMAENALIPPELWKSSAARANPTPMAVYELSQRAEVHMAVAAGRVRYEHNNYRLLSQFVGRGEVGRLFEGV
ncbi:MAG: ImmA/IrrE family metallo-endopeptidase [Caldilineaceae bacterium]|nr:ImmA/IrrE family metallo-endopeptidase [Caldilineaceae bacterium]MDE0632436.1 ImmA/IrrE family metallo-endopeptidase [Caldilineaceae bacterium]